MKPWKETLPVLLSKRYQREIIDILIIQNRRIIEYEDIPIFDDNRSFAFAYPYQRLKIECISFVGTLVKTISSQYKQTDEWTNKQTNKKEIRGKRKDIHLSKSISIFLFFFSFSSYTPFSFLPFLIRRKIARTFVIINLRSGLSIPNFFQAVFKPPPPTNGGGGGGGSLAGDRLLHRLGNNFS